jgi:hypothetical protein
MIETAGGIEINVEYEKPMQSVLTDEEYTLIVITPSEFADELEDLIDHKNSRDVSTKLVTLNEIYNSIYFPVQGRDDQEKIKYFIKKTIEGWGTSYVLFVGGSNEFPVRKTHIHIPRPSPEPDDNEIFVSDLYFADIYNGTGNFASWDTNENDVFGEYDWSDEHLTDEVDLYPDVYLGRLACINENQVMTCVNKIITYEINEAYKQNWFTDLVLVGGDTSPGDKNEINEGEYVNDAIADIMDGFIPDKVWVSNGRLSGIAPTGVKEINNAINKGCGFVDFSGHGNTNVWATHPHEEAGVWLPTPLGGYYSSNVGDLENGNELPIMLTDACCVFKFNKEKNSFGWSFLANPNGGGIASFGCTGLSWGTSGTSVIHICVTKLSLNVFKAYKNEGAITLGEMWGKSIRNYIDPHMDEYDHKSIEEWQLFGDPSLAVGEESTPPEKPDVPQGPTKTGVNKEHIYTTSTTDHDGDELYYLFDWGDGKYSGWVGLYNSGETAEASHTWTEQGDYEIRVKAKDDHGVQSEWSDPLPISMPKNKQLIDLPFFNFLEKFPRLFPILRNILGL